MMKKRLFGNFIKEFLGMSCYKVFILIFTFCLISFAAKSLMIEEKLQDQSLEQRAVQLFSKVRCLSCAGQVIESSDTEFSYQMRKEIRDKVAAGDSDQKIEDDLVKQFGDDILITIRYSSHIYLFLLPIMFAALLFIVPLLKIIKKRFFKFK